MRPRRSMGVLAGTLLVIAVVAGSAGASDPPGNNGTVKVDGVGFDDGPGGDPHADCSFQVEFAGFDEGDLRGTVRFELLPPTGRGELLVDSTPIGEDPAGGATDLDATLVADLSGPIAAAGVEPQAEQGFHVKLTVEAEGSIGATTKHKAFWVSCEGEGGGEEG